MMRQRKINRSLGKDTHVRDHSRNIFQSQNHETYGIQIGEIIFPQPEPLFAQNLVTIKMARGGQISSVAYPGAFIDPITGNLHGTYEGPIPGQMVTVGFENGNQATPFVVNRYPYQGTGNSLTELRYINPLTKSMYDATDVLVGHFSGSVMSFNTGILSGKLPGSVTLSAMTDLELNSNLFVQIKNPVQSMKTLIDALLDILDGFATSGSPTAHVTDPATKALIAAEKAKWALLLKE